MLISSTQRCNTAFFQGVAVVPLHDATGAQEPLCQKYILEMLQNVIYCHVRDGLNLQNTGYSNGVRNPTLSGILQLQD